MTAILFLLLVGVGLWRLGLSGVLRWAGIAGAGLGLCVVLGVDVAQGLPLLVVGVFLWVIGAGISAPRARSYRY
jgi:hypothetical protein